MPQHARFDLHGSPFEPGGRGREQRRPTPVKRGLPSVLTGAPATRVATDRREGGRAVAMAHALLEWETLDADQINDIMDGNDPRPPKAGLPAKRSPTDTTSGGMSPNATAPA